MFRDIKEKKDPSQKIEKIIMYRNKTVSGRMKKLIRHLGNEKYSQWNKKKQSTACVLDEHSEVNWSIIDSIKKLPGT